MSLVGKRLRRRRKDLGLTIAELSKTVGFSSSYISQVERGICSPSLSALGTIAASLGLALDEVFSRREELPSDKPSGEMVSRRSVHVVRRDLRKTLAYPGANVVNELLTPDLRRSFEFLWTELPPGEENRKTFYTHPGGGDECGVVLQGTIEFLADDEAIILHEGDSIYFNASVPHRWKSVGDVDAITVWVISPPDF